MSHEYPFIIGSYSIPSPWVGSPLAHGDGISFAVLDSRTGAMRVEKTIHEINPSFMRVDRHAQRVWVTTEPQFGGELLTFRGDAGGVGELLGRTSTGADAPCHFDIDPVRRLAFVSHFHGHCVSVLPLDDEGVAQEAVDLLASPTVIGDIDRSDVESRPHAALRVRADEVIVTDTGRDLVLLYCLGDDGAVHLADTLVMPTATGPRHLAWSPGLSTAFVSHQEDASLGVVRLEDTPSGPRLRLVDVVPSPGLGRAKPRPSEITLHPNGEVIYMANRIDNSLSVFEVTDEGARVELVDCVDVLGASPRQFALTQDARFLLVANGDSDEVQSFWVSADGRRIEWSGERLEVATPNFIAF